MTDVNHRRKNKLPVNQRRTATNHAYEYNNGYGAFNGERGNVQRVGNTDFLDKSMHGWGRKCQVADKQIGASIGNDYCNGHRGMAKAVAGAKKFVRSRTRFHDNQATKKLPIEDESN